METSALSFQLRPSTGSIKGGALHGRALSLGGLGPGLLAEKPCSGTSGCSLCSPGGLEPTAGGPLPSSGGLWSQKAMMLFFL